MVVKSAGIIMVRNTNQGLRFLCIKPGGPWKNMAWSIPKGGVEPDDKTLKDTAMREFGEETGQLVLETDLIPIGSIKQRKGKVVHAWFFVDNDNSPIKFRSNSYKIEHPKKSGKYVTFKEAISHKFLSAHEAKELLIPAQYELIRRIVKLFNDENEFKFGKSMTIHTQNDTYTDTYTPTHKNVESKRMISTKKDIVIH